MNIEEISATFLRRGRVFHHFTQKTEAGMIQVNLPTAGMDFHAPFTGAEKVRHSARLRRVATAESSLPIVRWFMHVTVSLTFLQRQAREVFIGLSGA
jgi:hypothetical protein